MKKELNFDIQNLSGKDGFSIRCSTLKRRNTHVFFEEGTFIRLSKHHPVIPNPGAWDCGFAVRNLPGEVVLSGEISPFAASAALRLLCRNDNLFQDETVSGNQIPNYNINRARHFLSHLALLLFFFSNISYKAIWSPKWPR